MSENAWLLLLSSCSLSLTKSSRLSRIHMVIPLAYNKAKGVFNRMPCLSHEMSNSFVR